MGYTITAPELALLNSTQFNFHVRVLIADPNGTLREMTALNGFDHLRGLTWGDDVDALVQFGTVQLLKRVGSQSIVPMDEASLLNRNGAVYEKFIRPGRQIQIFFAITAKGAAASVWYPIFDGYLDEWSAGNRTHLTVAFRDRGALLADFTILDEINYAAQSLESAIQTILDDAFGVGIVPLYTPAATGNTVAAFTQGAGNLMEAVRKLARENGGFDLRYKYDPGTAAFRLTLWLPDLVTTTPVHTLTPNEYVEVSELKENRDQVKNIIRVTYKTGVVQLSDAPSILAYKPRPLLVELSDSLETAAQASAAATAALADLSEPQADHAIENLIFPIVELRDIIG